MVHSKSGVENVQCEPGIPPRIYPLWLSDQLLLQNGPTPSKSTVVPSFWISLQRHPEDSFCCIPYSLMLDCMT